MNPPIPSAWFGLAFFFGIAATAVITRTLEGWSSLVPVPNTVPLATQKVLLTLELMVLAIFLPHQRYVALPALSPRTTTPFAFPPARTHLSK